MHTHAHRSQPFSASPTLPFPFLFLPTWCEALIVPFRSTILLSGLIVCLVNKVASQGHFDPLCCFFLPERCYFRPFLFITSLLLWSCAGPEVSTSCQPTGNFSILAWVRSKCLGFSRLLIFAWGVGPRTEGVPAGSMEPPGFLCAAAARSLEAESTNLRDSPTFLPCFLPPFSPSLGACLRRGLLPSLPPTFLSLKNT